MRVHGDKIIKRSPDILEKKHYEDYYDDLKKDFHNMCGYCGKNCDNYEVKYQIDHFVPIDTNSKRENDYTNLVLSCRKCNRLKWYDWPTKDPDKPNDGLKGYVDPACDDFDNHLYRDDSGKIFYSSDVGSYMHSKLKFDIRSTDIIWAINRLSFELEKLEFLIEQQEKKSSEPINEDTEYRKISKKIKEYKKALFADGETF